MKRPMCVIGLTLALTMLAAFAFSARETLLLSGAAALTGVFVALLGKKSLRAVSLACMTAAVGFAVHSAYSRANIAPFERAAGQTVAVQGYITEATLSRRAIFYTLDARFPDRPDLPNATLSLRTFSELEYNAGEVIGCQATLDEEVAAPGDYTFSQGGFASGLAVGPIARLQGGYPVERRLQALRDWMMGNLYDALPEESAEVVAAMVLNLAEDVDSDTYSALNRAGTAHILSVSGLHLSILTAGLLRILESFGLKRRRASLLAILAAALFALFVGFSPSMTRALIMTAITLAARMGRRRPDSLSSLGLAMAVICLARPEWVLGRGLWFSAAATLGILLMSGRLERRALGWLTERGREPSGAARFFLSAGAVSVAAYLFTLPLSILFSGWFSLLSPVTNLIIAPFELPILLGGILLALFGGGSLLLALIARLTYFCLAVVLAVSGAIANLPFATLAMDEGWMLVWLAMLLATALVLYRFRGNLRLMSYGALLAVAVFSLGSLSSSLADRGRVQLALLADCDAAVLLRGGEAVILGAPEANEATRLLRYLEFRGVREIRAVVATDIDQQVTSGLLRLTERYPVSCVIAPEDAYMVDQLALAMPGVPVYPGGNLEAELLGGAVIDTSQPEEGIRLATKDGSVLKSAAEYDILGETVYDRILIYKEGDVVLRAAPGFDPSSMGALLFGEQRFRLRVWE